MHTHFARLLLPAGLALSSLTMAPAQAALVLTDDSLFGSQAVVRDTVSGLEWLRLDFSYGLTYAHVASQLGSGQAFADWTIASEAALITLLGGANAIVQGSTDAASLAAAAGLRDMICFTAGACKDVSSTHDYARGLIADVHDGGSFFAQEAFSVGVAFVGDSGGPEVDFRTSGWGSRESTVEAVWLYRGDLTQSVPEPGNMALLLAGATALGVMHRRRRSAG